MTGVLITRESLDIEPHTERIPCKDEDSNWGDSFMSQGTAKNATDHQRHRTESLS